MIITERRPRWLHLIFRYRGTELERIKFRLIAVALVALAVSVAHDLYGLLPRTLTAMPFTLIVVALEEVVEGDGGCLIHTAEGFDARDQRLAPVLVHVRLLYSF